MAKLIASFSFFFIFLSCNKNCDEDLSITLKEIKNDRLFYEITNNSIEHKTIFINEIPNIYINKKKIEENTSFKPLSIVFYSESDAKVKVNIFANKDYIKKIKNNDTKEIILKTKEKFYSSLLVDTTGKYSIYTPDLNDVKSVKLKVIYQGSEMNKIFKIKNNLHYVDEDIVSNNEIILK